MTAKLKTYTLGCKVNQYETEFVRQGLLRAGYQDVAEDETADVCIVNTCTVTAEGDSKSRQVIRRLHKDNPDARIVVMGCYATRAPDEVRRLPGVVEVVTDKRELPDLLGRHGVVDLPTGIAGLTGHRRAFVKVQDGCLLNCSYCIIPKVRPQMYSRQLEDVLREIEGLEQNGYQEVVLTGIHLGHYGVDFNRGLPRQEWTRLATLVRQICRRTTRLRVRLSSIEATEVTRELIDVMVEYAERFCPHLHVCLQSGSDRILRLMRRRWSAKRIIDRCQLVAERLARPAFTTDVIVGFPGETAEDFAATESVCRQIGFAKLHVFPFSPRRGTAAAEMSEQVDGNIKAARVDKLMELDRELRGVYLDQLLGSEITVMAEQPVAGRWVGTSCRAVTAAVATSRPIVRGELIKARVLGRDGEQLSCQG
ncbi:MAG: tRNA (N(6)-L-threonylcarbamoyladenosine(37)-C(2))-methylthiotransferase MtaB [Blastopirellula sp.]|nr:tRNA (N(6)-L-threonylcarbamoyladenosine(37)-C(2))-methylthiotransferase MtaB [Blastopirellula sp.]